MWQNLKGRELFEYLAASPDNYSVTGNMPSFVAAFANSSDPEDALGVFVPLGNDEDGPQCRSAVGTVFLFDELVHAQKWNPVENLAHELTHAGLYDHEVYPDRGGVPVVIMQYAPYSRGGALPFFQHKFMDLGWQAEFPGSYF